MSQVSEKSTPLLLLSLLFNQSIKVYIAPLQEALNDIINIIIIVTTNIIVIIYYYHY